MKPPSPSPSIFVRRWRLSGFCLRASLCLPVAVYLAVTVGLSASVFLMEAGQAQTAPAGDTLAPFEQTLFSRDFAGETTASRLERLESSVFGGAQPGSDAERQSRLVKALSAAQAVIPNANAAKNDNAAENEPGTGINRYTNSASGTSAGGGDAEAPAGGSDGSPKMAPPGDSDYPTVTALEREAFSRDFVREDVAHRLERLEKRAYGQASPQMALSDRVDRLLVTYPNAASDVARYTRAAAGGNTEGTVSPAVRSLPNDSGQFVGSMDAYAKVGALEKLFFNGKTYDGELLTQRLDRLEAKAYGQPYSGQSVDTRLNRLLSAYRVGARNKPFPKDLLRQPDPAKWQSPPAVGYTGSFLSPAQRGTRNYGSSNMGAASGAPPQNIQIGAGFSSSSASASSFSPEMRAMLPPSLQQQFGTGAGMQQQQSSTMVGAPGTVITQESTSYPGFQAYGGQSLQTYNYYGNPGLQTQTQSSTTVISPNGGPVSGPVTFNSTQTATLPGGMAVNPYGLPAPAYVGDPAVLQSLGNIEISVYGQVDMVNPVSIRLARLEMAMLHQVYPSYPDAQRVANLQRAYQLQSVGRVLGNGKAANLGRAAGSMLFGVPLGGAQPNMGNPVMPYPTFPGH